VVVLHDGDFDRLRFAMRRGCGCIRDGMEDAFEGHQFSFTSFLFNLLYFSLQSEIRQYEVPD
jgi:hypothetical protein